MGNFRDILSAYDLYNLKYYDLHGRQLYAHDSLFVLRKQKYGFHNHCLLMTKCFTPKASGVSFMANWTTGLKAQPISFVWKEAAEPKNKHSGREIISSGELQEGFGKGEKLATKIRVLSHKAAGWNILESRWVVLKPLYSEKRALKVLHWWPW